MTSTEPDTYKNYKSTDKEYYRLYNKKLWDEKLGVPVACDLCGEFVQFGGLRRHKRTSICERVRCNGDSKLIKTNSEIIKELEIMIKELQSKV